MSEREPPLLTTFLGEVIGTFILIFFGLGAVHAAVTTGTYSGVLQVAALWGIGVMVAVYAVGSLSGAHLNPSITLAFALWGGFPRARVFHYVLAQLAGAALAALALHLIFDGAISAFEEKSGILRGQAGSVITASMYGEYFPNPTVPLHGPGEGGYKNVGVFQAFLAELLGTAILALSVFALTDKKSAGAPQSNLAPLFIGLTVAGVISVIGPLTQSCLNPARDFAPRLVAYFSGWGEVALPGPRGWAATLLVYLVAPLAGGTLGGWIQTRVLGSNRSS
jgi:glycerol uptake facilitator protein